MSGNGRSGEGFVWWLSLGEQVVNPERFAVVDPLAGTIRAALLNQPGGPANLETLRSELETMRQDRDAFGELVRASLECMWADRRETRAAHGRNGGAVNKEKANHSYPTYKPEWEAARQGLQNRTTGRRIGVGEVDRAVAKKLGVDPKTIARARLQNWRDA
jgi:hypothetical protein